MSPRLTKLWLYLLRLSSPGSLALPSLTKLASVLGGKLQATWHSGEQIPVEIALPAELRFHSVATCPVEPSPEPQPQPQPDPNPKQVGRILQLVFEDQNFVISVGARHARVGMATLSRAKKGSIGMQTIHPHNHPQHPRNHLHQPHHPPHLYHHHHHLQASVRASAAGSSSSSASHFPRERSATPTVSC